MIKRAQRGAPCIEARSNVAVSPANLPSISGAIIELLLPINFTNPPNGNAAICHFVPFLSLNANRIGPNPIEKTSACIPLTLPMK